MSGLHEIQLEKSKMFLLVTIDELGILQQFAGPHPLPLTENGRHRIPSPMIGQYIIYNWAHVKITCSEVCFA